MRTWTTGRSLLATALLVTLTIGLQPALAEPRVAGLEVLSSRADLASGGDALVEVQLAAGADPAKVRVTLNDQDVTNVFEVRDDGRMIGLVEGLHVGDNRLQAQGSRLTITNHPQGGPIFSGPQIQPWYCDTQARGLGPAVDPECNAAPRYELFYRSTRTGGFEAYDPSDPPDDGEVAFTTTDQGRRVRYIVRRETGTQNRGIYQVAVLFDPSQPGEPRQQLEGWNHKLFYPFGEGCAQYREQAPFPLRDVLDHNALRRGFMVATSSLNELGSSCNTVVSAESMMMVKERIIEQYGQIRFTFGRGGSGGSIGQHEIANAYPGLLQGLMTTESFPDVWSSPLSEVYDCHLLNRYYLTVSPHLWADPTDQAAVNGMQAVTTCAAWEATFGNADGGEEFRKGGSPDPRGGCGFINDNRFEMYDPDTNPAGCRGTFQDFNAATLGVRPAESWTDAEKAAGFGFAKLPWDNVGVQYGLAALESGQIIAEQFVDLNEKVGGLDLDWQFQPQRTSADAGALQAAYRSGRVVNDARQLDQVAIIDRRAANNGGTAEIHTSFHSWSMKERITRAHGEAPNHVIWTAGAPPGGNFDTMDQWLTAVEADTSDTPLSAKLTNNRPPQAVDACWVAGQMTTDQELCGTLYPYYGSPRTAAAGGRFVANQILKCQLTPLQRDDYPVEFTDDQWRRLQDSFPGGVCDWDQPSVEQVPSVPWLTYTAGPGGQPLGEPPT